MLTDDGHFSRINPFTAGLDDEPEQQRKAGCLGITVLYCRRKNCAILASKHVTISRWFDLPSYRPMTESESWKPMI
ncbi:MAG: hypothetical protein ACU837_17090 [Gammaproteobacteria bacterium]